MNDIRFKATFTSSNRVVLFSLSAVVLSMGHQCAEDVSLEEEIGEDLAYLFYNWRDAILEVIDKKE